MWPLIPDVDSTYAHSNTRISKVMLRLHLYRNVSEATQENHTAISEGWWVLISKKKKKGKKLKPGEWNKDMLCFLRQPVKGLGSSGYDECYQLAAEDRKPALLCLHQQNAFLLGYLVFLGATSSSALSQGTWHHSPAHWNPLHPVPQSLQPAFLLAEVVFTNCTDRLGNFWQRTAYKKAQIFFISLIVQRARL